MSNDLVVVFSNGLTKVFEDEENVKRLYGWFYSEKDETILIVESKNIYILKRSQICYMVLREREF